MAKKVTPKKTISQSKQAQVILKRCAIIGSVSLIIPFLASFFLFLMNYFPAMMKDGVMPGFLVIFIAYTTIAGLLAGPVLLIAAMACGVIILSRVSHIKSLAIRKKYIIIAMALMIATALIAFLLPKLYESSGFLDFSMNG